MPADALVNLKNIPRIVNLRENENMADEVKDFFDRPPSYAIFIQQLRAFRPLRYHCLLICLFRAHSKYSNVKNELSSAGFQAIYDATYGQIISLYIKDVYSV